MAVTLTPVSPGLVRVVKDGREVGFIQSRSGRYLPLLPDGKAVGHSRSSRQRAIAVLTGERS